MFLNIKTLRKVIVLSNEREISADSKGVIHMPIYFIMFFEKGRCASISPLPL